MFNPDLRGVLQNHLSRYSLVTATAKRAREIAEEAEDKKIIMTEKPVSVALEEILNGDYVIVEPEEIRNI
ncbi:MAG: DNA-directed RNA polymerase subunit omega [Oscillospiraceae bacterium]|nr:DNA-directed RNA polymerase subunit omega [Clostridiaceae bacterium]MDO4495005.1 DNA-directed RNA polymerase subunit omega [Clostridiaceae bacterium]MDY5947863.1 DNA-directed RNA polymerase subunit omega [Oscillospiraceae bacterium]